MNALVVHHSRTGRTRRYAEAIAAHLAGRGIGVRKTSISAFRAEMLEGADLVLLGCWTHGWFVVNQHPDADWVAFAGALPSLAGRKVCLFTTYLLVTGSMFRRMRRRIPGAPRDPLTLQSRSAELSARDADRLDRWVEAGA